MKHYYKKVLTAEKVSEWISDYCTERGLELEDDSRIYEALPCPLIVSNYWVNDAIDPRDWDYDELPHECLKAYKALKPFGKGIWEIVCDGIRRMEAEEYEDYDND